VRKFISIIWEKVGIDMMLVSSNGSPTSNKQPIIIKDPKGLNGINPFKPLMTFNIAKFVPKFISEYINAQLGTILRPCELRALEEMAKRGLFSNQHLLTICVDCLGTYSIDEYQWHAERKGSAEYLTQEVFNYASQGNLVPHRYRLACQICKSPQATGAMINLGVLGLPVRKYLLINISDENIAKRLQLDQYAYKRPDREIIVQRNRTLSKIIECNNRVHERIKQGLGDILPTNINEFIDMLHTCRSCQNCMYVCPICEIDFPHRDNNGRYSSEIITRWLSSCTLCGMCEQSCPHHQPLSVIISNIRQQISNQLGYHPKDSVKEIPLI